MKAAEVYAGSDGTVTRAAGRWQRKPRTFIPQGSTFGKWTTLTHGIRCSDRILCRCECGLERTILAMSLLRGDSKYCGKYSRHPEVRTNATKHGENAAGQKTKEYQAWLHIKARCLNHNCAVYSYYGGRGIRMAPAWERSFDAFLKDVGRAPSLKHTIERIDTNGHYEPGNVKWATALEQARNKRRNIRLEFNGETMPIADWAARIGISIGALRQRLKRRWSLERALCAAKTE